MNAFDNSLVNWLVKTFAPSDYAQMLNVRLEAAKKIEDNRKANIEAKRLEKIADDEKNILRIATPLINTNTAGFIADVNLLLTDAHQPTLDELAAPAGQHGVELLEKSGLKAKEAEDIQAEADDLNNKGTALVNASKRFSTKTQA